MIFKVDFGRGRMLVEAHDVDDAEMWAEHRFGECDGPYYGTKATERDISEIKAFGGIVHKINYKKV